MKEKEALKSARDSYCYALNVLQGRFEKGENVISKESMYSELYRENIYDAEKELKIKLEKEQKELEAIKKSINVNCLYGIEV